jgi:hypothetical protein
VVAHSKRTYYRARELGQEAPFPHEIGIVLGYPVSDVKAFMAKQPTQMRGRWCVYGDHARAAAQFAQLNRIDRQYAASFKNGTTLAELVLSKAQ